MLWVELMCCFMVQEQKRRFWVNSLRQEDQYRCDCLFHTEALDSRITIRRLVAADYLLMTERKIMAIYTYDDLINSFSEERLAAARQYAEEGRVLDLKVSDDGMSISGRVQCSRSFPYEPQVHMIVNGENSIEIFGSCTCGNGMNCHHAGAMLVHELARHEENQATEHIHREGINLRLMRWLDQLETAHKPKIADETDEETGVADHWLAYVIDLRRPDYAAPELRVSLRKAVQQTSEETGKTAIIAEGGLLDAREMLQEGRKPLWLQTADIRLLKTLLGLRQSEEDERAPFILSGDEGGQILQALLATGRAVWKDVGGLALSSAPSRKGSPIWREKADGTQWLSFEIDAADIALPLCPALYLDKGTGAVGIIETEFNDPVTAALTVAPPVPPQQAFNLREELESRFPDLGLPLPRGFTDADRQRVKPTPHLKLVLADLPLSDEGAVDFGEDESVPLARLLFDYDGIRIPSSDGREDITRLEDGKLKIIHRDKPFETQSMTRLTHCGFKPVIEQSIYDVSTENRGDLILIPQNPKLDRLAPESSLMQFVHVEVPRLKEEGWTVEIEGDFPYHEAKEVDDWFATVGQTESEIDWFDLELGVEIEGRKINLLPILTHIISQFDKRFDLTSLEAYPDDHMIFAPLGDGGFLPIPMKTLRPMLAAIQNVYRIDGLNEEGKLEFDTLHAAEMAHLEHVTSQLGFTWSGGEKIRAMGEKLRNFKGIEQADYPAPFDDILRPYQRHGVDWLQFLRAFGFGGVLADDMGLGKTIQALCHMSIEKQSGRADLPILVVAPTSLMANWRIEANRFAPDLRVLTLHGSDRHDYYDAIDDHDLILTTYPLLVRDKEKLLERTFHMVILDEAQMIKNPKAGTTQAAHQLKARHKLCMTGTPMENHLGELWSLFHFLMPGLLGDQNTFRDQFRNPIEKLGDADRQAYLSQRVKPFLLRRTKQAVVKELPEKVEMIEHIELEGEQRRLYETIRISMQEKVRSAINKKGVGGSHIVILDALLKLRQICCDPRLLKLDAAKDVHDSAKLERLIEMVTEMIEEGRKILLFSQFTSMLKLIEEELKLVGIDYVKLTGDTKDRETPVRQFQEGEVPIFLISLKAGGTGLNLTAADTVIHYDPWWNPAVEAQATDRAYRIGQDKSVFVYKMMTMGTVEEKIQEMQERKRTLADNLYADGQTGHAAEGGKQKFSESELESLLAPLEHFGGDTKASARKKQTETAA